MMWRKKDPRGDKDKADGNGCSEHKGVCRDEGEERFKQKEKERKGGDAIAIETRARFMIEGEGATRLFITEQVRDYVPLNFEGWSRAYVNKGPRT